jgi:SAM-dependent methyltransferase
MASSDHPADPAATLRATYDCIAPDYAAANGSVQPAALAPYTPRFFAAALEAAASAKALRPRVIDAGCGPGRDTAWLEGEGFDVVGVDLSTGMLKEARTRVRGPLLQMDMRRLAFQWGVFHGAWCNASLLHIPRAEAPGVLSQIAKLLVPGAPLHLSLQGGDGETWEHAAYGHTVDRFFARYQPDEVASMLADAGFALQEQHQVPAGSRLWLRFFALAL